MPLVFIHGVKVRKDKDYQAGVAARDALFRRFELAAVFPDPAVVQILNPYWGDGGAWFRWGLACLPARAQSAEGLGGGQTDPAAGPLAAALLARGGASDPDHLVLEAARADFPATVDLLFAAGVLEAGAGAGPFAESAARAAVYADANPEPPGWLDQVDSDGSLLHRLQVEVEATAPVEPCGPHAVAAVRVEALGIGDVWGAIRDGVDRARVAAGDLVGSRIYDLVRDLLAPTVATFAGDVFEYLSHRGTAQQPGPIPAAVLAGLRAGHAARTERDQKLIVIGHSLGGVVGYDVLTSFAPELRVDALVTVGSQVGLFEELKQFLVSDRRIPSATVPRLRLPPQFRHWINVYDENDLLSYRLQPLVDSVEEFRYVTGEVLAAHVAYFGQPRFHQRLAERLRTALA